MNDEDTAVHGHTRWRRFALTFGIAAAATGVLLTSMANGAIAASFTISGGAFKISADQLRGSGVVQYGSVENSADNKANPVLVVGMTNAEMDNFCQSVVLPAMPGVGEMTIRITSAGSKGVTANNLLVGIQQANGTMTLRNVDLGVDAGRLEKGPGKGTPGTFGIQSDGMVFDGLKQVALSTTAGTMSLNQVQINALGGRHECF